MTADAPFEPQAVIAALNRAHVRYVIVGGLAVAAHGVVRATHDLDVVPDPEASNLAALAGSLAGLGRTHPIEDALTGENLARPAAITVHTRHGDVQVLNRMSSIPPWPDLYADRMTVELTDGTRAPICSLRHLVEMKRAAGRPRDQVDLAELSAVHDDDSHLMRPVRRAPPSRSRSAPRRQAPPRRAGRHQLVEERVERCSGRRHPRCSSAGHGSRGLIGDPQQVPKHRSSR